MNYDDVHDRVESVLLSMVDAGTAAHAGVGPHGPTFTVDRDEVWAAAERAGLLADDVPWSFSLAAVCRLRADPDR